MKLAPLDTPQEEACKCIIKQGTADTMYIVKFGKNGEIMSSKAQIEQISDKSFYNNHQ